MTFCNSSSIRLRSAAADSSLPFFDCCSRFSHARANASAEALARACENLEQQSKKGRLESAAADLKRIEEELQKVIAVLEGEKVRLGL